MPRVIHFEIAANNPESLVSFYRTVFGWEITKWNGPIDYWLIKTGEAGTRGIDGALFRPTETFTATVNTIEVDDIDAYAERVKSAGGTIVVEKNAIPGVGYQFYFKDPDGTLVGVHQADARAGMPAQPGA
jgi:predicted enzyme related to lactoylglutathione lyase